MAFATLRRDGEFRGRPAFVIRTEPWGTGGSYSGPPNRDWSSFSASGEDSASYEWRTGVDKLLEAAHEFVAGRRTLSEVLNDSQVSWWLEHNLESLLAGLTDDEEHGAPTEEQVMERLLRSVADGAIDPDTYDGKHAYYFFEWDNFTADAARALELPPWAEQVSREGGGPGTGYLAQYVTLKPGKSLLDLEEWLGKR